MSNGPIFTWVFQYQNKVQPVPANEDISRLEWTIIWTEPVRIKPGFHPSRQSFLALSPTPVTPATGTGDLNWFAPWSFVTSQTFMLGEG